MRSLERRSMLYALLVILVSQHYQPTSTVGKGGEKMKTDTVDWESYLGETAELHGWHYTLEYVSDSEGSKWTHKVPQTAVINIDELIQLLSRHVPEFEFVKAESQDNVIHVIQKRAAAWEGYALAKTLDFEYEGNIDLVSRELGRRLGNIGTIWDEPVKSTIDARHGDPATQVKIAAKHKTVRAILTDCVPLKGYYVKLWWARTRRVDGKPKTVVQYQGRDRAAQ